MQPHDPGQHYSQYAQRRRAVPLKRSRYPQRLDPVRVTVAALILLAVAGFWALLYFWGSR